MTITVEELSKDDLHFAQSLNHHDDVIAEQPLVQSKASTQLLLSNKFVTHTPQSGLNPLVDAAAYLFSVLGKLRQIKSYRHLTQLRKELIREINLFQEVVKTQGYSSEYIMVSRYAICATLDDVISNTPWGAQGQWDKHTLLAAFNQDSITQERFFAILERLIKDPKLYIDVMEFIYICLNLGFKGHFQTTEFNTHQLEQLTNALYKRIRAYRGDFSKTLSPFSLKPPVTTAPSKSLPNWAIILLAVGFSLSLFAGIRYALNLTSAQAYKDLTQMRKITHYEKVTPIFGSA